MSDSISAMNIRTHQKIKMPGKIDRETEVAIRVSILLINVQFYRKSLHAHTGMGNQSLLFPSPNLS